MPVLPGHRRLFRINNETLNVEVRYLDGRGVVTQIIPPSNYERTLLEQNGVLEAQSVIDYEDSGEIPNPDSPISVELAQPQAFETMPYYDEGQDDDPEPEPAEPPQEAMPRTGNARTYQNFIAGNPHFGMPTSAQPERPASRPARSRAESLPADDRSQRIINTLPLYIEAVKTRIRLWKIMEEISVALEQSLARINRFDVEDSQVDGTAAGFEDEVCADGLNVEDMCDALRIEYPTMRAGERQVEY